VITTTVLSGAVDTPLVVRLGDSIEVGALGAVAAERLSTD
jgi:hypothetical protein